MMVGRAHRAGPDGNLVQRWRPSALPMLVLAIQIRADVGTAGPLPRNVTAALQSGDVQVNRASGLNSFNGFHDLVVVWRLMKRFLSWIAQFPVDIFV